MINTPQNQKVLTNVCVVRLKKGGKRFEIACYPNTVVAWRTGAQKDLSEVLQASAVFTNVSKGVSARKDEMQKAFGTADVDAVVREILATGELQVGDMERKAMLEATFKDIATIVSEKCVNPRTQRPIPVTMVEKAMRDVLHYSVVPRKNAKQQALDVIRLLRERGFPIARAPMRLRVVVPGECAPALLPRLRELCTEVSVRDDSGTPLTVPPPGEADAAAAAAAAPGASVVASVTLDPSRFRDCEALVKECAGARGKVEVVSVAQQSQGDTAV